MLLTQAQQDWLIIQRTVANTKPRKKHPVPTGRACRAAYVVVKSDVFDNFIILVIVLNAISMMMVHTGQVGLSLLKERKWL